MGKNNYERASGSSDKKNLMACHFLKTIEICSLSRIFILISIHIFGWISICAQTKTIKLPFTISETKGFTKNNGQILNQYQQKNKEVKYLFHAKALNVELKKNSFSYDTYETESNKIISHSPGIGFGKMLKKGSTVYHFHRVDIRFPGSKPSPKILVEGQLANYTTYCNTANIQGIRVHSYKKVIYKEIYPLIDLVFENKSVNDQNGFEYYFIVKPGGDANKIRIQYSGTETKLENNSIIIPLEKRKIIESIPFSFVSIDTTYSFGQIKNESQFKVRYKAQGKNTYSFFIPLYDKTRTIIIDPVPDLVWGTYYGGSINDWANAIDTSPNGTIVVVGGSDNTNLATSGAYQTTLNGYSDALIGQFTSDGNLVWMTYFGGESEESAFGTCIDNNGNIYVVGITDSKTGISTPGSFQPMPGNPGYDRDAFIAKFTSSGNRIWATYYGGSDVDYLHAVKTDNNGNVFVAGWTYSRNAIATPGCFQAAYASDANPQDWSDGCLARFDQNGNRIWSTYFGSTRFDRFYALDIDANDNLFAAGITNSSTNIASSGAFQTTLPGTNDAALLVKFDMNGKRLWSTYDGGTLDDYAQAVTCDKQNNVIIGGIAESTTGISTTGAFQPTYGGAVRDAFAVKFNSAGGRVWGTYYGGSGEDMIYGIKCDANNNIIICGSTYSTNNIATPNSYQTSGPSILGDWTAFVAKLTPGGNRTWGTYYGYGGVNSGFATAVTCDSAGNIFVCGQTLASTNVSTCNAIQPTLAGNADIFVGMFSETIIPLVVSVNINTNQNNSICAGVPVTFNATSINGGTNPSYQWKINGVNAGTDSSGFTVITLKNGDKISCMVTSSIPCIVNPTANSNVITIIISSSVIPSVSIATSATGSICANTPVTFTATPLNGGNSPSYQWQINGINVGTNSPLFITSNLLNGNAIKCILTNSSSCNTITSTISNSIVVSVTVAVYPSISITVSSSEVCSGTTVTFIASELNGGSNPTYDWQLNGLSVGSGNTYTNATLSDGDSVHCFLIPDNTGCYNSSRIPSNKISILIDPLPSFIIQPINPQISLGDTLQLSVIDTADILKYKWTPNQTIINDSIRNTKVWPANTQTYSLEAASQKGCKKTGQVTVEVITRLFIPTAFTPNNDGINDTWEIKGLEIYPKCTVNIYDRFGEHVFKSSGYNTSWNGSYKNKILPLGVFVYIIDLNNGSKPLTGIVTIIR
jgi:gliding motility-associated-like protein